MDCGSCHPARELRSSALRLPWSSGGTLVAARRLRNPFEEVWGHGTGGERTTTSPPRECRVPRVKKADLNPYEVGVAPRARARAGSAENTKTLFLGSQGIKKPALPVVDKAGGFAI